MERIWAPWRMEYVGRPREESCFLCRAWDAEDQEAHRVLAKGKGTFVLMNLFPYNNGHLMVATAAHVPGLAGLPDEKRLELLKMIEDSVAPGE